MVALLASNTTTANNNNNNNKNMKSPSTTTTTIVNQSPAGGVKNGISSKRMIITNNKHNNNKNSTTTTTSTLSSSSSSNVLFLQKQTMARKLRIQQLLQPTIPSSMILTALLQLLIDYPVVDDENSNNNNNNNNNNNTVVYLMDRTYLQNWFLWASKQIVPEHEQSRTQEALQMATMQLGLHIPPSYSHNNKNNNGSSCTNVDNGKNHTDDNNKNNNNNANQDEARIIGEEDDCNNNDDDWCPSPMDNSALSFDGHPLLLDYAVQVMKPTITTTSSSSSTQQEGITKTKNSGNNKKNSTNRMSQSLNLHQRYTNKDKNSNKMLLDDPRMSRSLNRSSTSSSTYLNINNNNNKKKVDSCLSDDDDDNIIPKECLAVPESFYSTLRQVHGVLCDDYYTISYQPYTASDHPEDEDHILQHYIYSHPTTTTTTSTNQQQQQQQQPVISTYQPRPIEFRRKVVRQVDTELINQLRMKHENPTTNLMEKLLLEEQITSNNIPTVLAVEIHPVKLIYSLITHSSQQQQQHQQEDEHLHYLQPKGFVLVSNTTPAVDAIQALMRVAEPNKASQSVRCWSQWAYCNSNEGVEATTTGGNNNNNNTIVAEKTKWYPTKFGDGYELVDLDLLVESNNDDKNNKKSKNKMEGTETTRNNTNPNNNNINNTAAPSTESTADIEADRVTIGEWVRMHHHHYNNHNNNNDNNDNNNKISLLQQQDEGQELHMLIETRRTVNSDWPRDAVTLSSRISPGDYIDAQDVAGKWYEAFVKSVHDDYIVVHYAGWASKWDAKIPRYPPHQRRSSKNNDGNGESGQPTTNSSKDDNGNHLPAASPSASSVGTSSKVKPPAPIWSQSGRWREELQVGDVVEVRDTSSLAERPKWYRGVIKKIGHPVSDTIYDMSGGAELEEYSVFCESYSCSSLPQNDDDDDNDSETNVGFFNMEDSSNNNHNKTTTKETNKSVGSATDVDDNVTTSTSSASSRALPLLILRRTQQILVEVEQERTYKARNLMNDTTASSSLRNLENYSKETINQDLTPNPPFLRWINLYGEEICKFGTHLPIALARPNTATGGTESSSAPPVTLTYEYESYRKPVEIMKGHPMHGSGFMRESLRGTPPAPGSVGLHNLGNSCFLNSIVQCLNHIRPITQHFLEDKYSKDLNKSNPLGSGGNVSVAYASLLKKIWAGNHSILVPRLLKQTVASFAPQFDNSYQHDSHEFCQFLMDGLHEDLNRVKTKPYVEELDGIGMDDNIAGIESWRKHLLRHDSIIVDHCQGMHRSHLTCPQCGRESIKFDVYSSISLPLRTEKYTSPSTVINLEDCMDWFMEAEQLGERDAYYCPNCRRHVCALKLIALWTVPDVLILHLKRFTFDTCMTSGNMLRSKIDLTVNFPIDGLDLTKKVLGPIDPEAPPIYNLFGVSEHVGPTANSGHYTATVRNSVDGLWYRCNDSHVGRTSGEAAVTGGAYLLFYQRAKGLSKWGGLAKVMKDRGINPYGGLLKAPVIDSEGFTQVGTKKKTKVGSTSVTNTTKK